MSYFLTGLFSAMIGGSVVFLTMCALRMASIESRAEERSGAPEGPYHVPEVR